MCRVLCETWQVEQREGEGVVCTTDEGNQELIVLFFFSYIGKVKKEWNERKEKKKVD